MIQLPPQVAAVVDVLRGVHFDWAIGGGWAIDLALGRVTRSHGDVDVVVFRDEQTALRRTLQGFDFEIVVDGVPGPWQRDEWLRLPVHEIRARTRDGKQAIEVLLNEREGSDWVYRRDPHVRRPLSCVFRACRDDVRVLAPEVVLLYKSKAPRAVDEHDFRVARALLDDDARRWLIAALRRLDTEHPWIDALATKP
jgi:hypothetical protein